MKNVQNALSDILKDFLAKALPQSEGIEIV